MPLPADILAALTAHRGHRAHAAAALGLSLRTLARRLEGHADELAALAADLGWPSRTAAATESAARPDVCSRRGRSRARRRWGAKAEA